jgi:hypothetical protein
MFKLIVGPAYGRDYKSKKAVLADWNAGKDFVILSADSPNMGGYANKEDIDRMGGVQWVNIRYDNNRKVLPLKQASRVVPEFERRLARTCPEMYQQGKFVYPTGRTAAYGDWPSGLDPQQEHLWDSLWLIATNDGSSYAKRDAKGAVAKAFKDYSRSESRRIREDFGVIQREMTTQLGGYWHANRGAAGSNVVFRAQTRGGKFSIEVTDDGDGTFSMTSYTGGRSSGRAVGHNEAQMTKRVKDELANAKQFDGILYKVTQDNLGVGRFASST